jgi:hypothetical protein
MTSNPNSPDFNYKKYSLEKLQEWVHDALSCGEASPHEIYSAIREAVREDYYYYKDHCSRAYGLLELLSGHRPVADNSTFVCDKDDKSPECQSAWNDFWEENYYPEEYKQYTEEEMNAMCDKAASEQEKEKCREYNLREAEYYDKRAKLDADYAAIKAAGGYEWTPLPETKKDKPKKWVLLVEEVRDEDTDKDECCVTFPDDLLEAVNLKEGDEIEWVDKGDGSYLLKKV